MDVTRGKIDDAIIAWRDGATFNAVHPLEDGDPRHVGTWLWDDGAVKDLARVIFHTMADREIPSKPVPW